MSDNMLANAGRFCIIKLSRLMKSTRIYNTIHSLAIPGKGFYTEPEPHSSPWVWMGEDSEAGWPGLLHLVAAETLG